MNQQSAADKAARLRRGGLLDAPERHVRPANPGTVTFDQWFDRQNPGFTDIVPIECARGGDRQVLAACGSGRNDMPTIDLAPLADIPTVRSIVATTFVECSRSLANIDELLMKVGQGLVPTAETLANLPNLRRLWTGVMLGRRPLALECLPAELEALAISRHLFRDGMQQRADFGQLHRFPALRQLALSFCWPKDSAAPLAELPNLVRLRCDAPRGWANFKNCHKLEHLSISPAMTNLRPFKNLTRLRELNVAGRGLGSLDGADAFSSLERLTLNLSKVTSLEPLRGLPRLETVHVSGTKTIRDLDPLGGLSALRTLTVKWHSDGFDEIVRIPSIRPLANAGTLEEVDLRGTIIEDGDLSALASLPALRKVQLFGELGAAVARLRKARPDVEVVWQEPKKPTGEKIGLVYLQKPVTGSVDWWIAQDMTGILATSTNYAAEKKLKQALKRDAPELLAGLRFDTEADNVVLLAKDQQLLRAVARFIERMTS